MSILDKSSKLEEVVRVNEVRKSDVLSGRGNGVAIHEGNQFYSRLVKDNKEEYQNRANSARKKQIALGIIDIITNQEPQGRFLKPKIGEAFVWVVQNDQYAMKKITQALREKSKKDKKSNVSDESGARDSLKRQMEFNSDKHLISCDNNISKDCASPDVVYQDFTSQEFVSQNEFTSQGFPSSNLVSKEFQEAIKSDEVVSNAAFKVSNPNYRPLKKSLCGTSKRNFFKWMSAESKLNLLKASLRSLDANSDRNLNSPSSFEVRDGMEKLSACDFDEKGSSFTTLATGCLSVENDDEEYDIECIDLGENGEKFGRRELMKLLASDDISKSMKNLNIFNDIPSDTEEEETTCQAVQN